MVVSNIVVDFDRPHLQSDCGFRHSIHWRPSWLCGWLHKRLKSNQSRGFFRGRPGRDPTLAKGAQRSRHCCPVEVIRYQGKQMIYVPSRRLVFSLVVVGSRHASRWQSRSRESPYKLFSKQSDTGVRFNLKENTAFTHGGKNLRSYQGGKS